LIGLEQAGERFINGSTSRVLVVGTYKSGEDGITTNNGSIFTSNSSIFTEEDLGRPQRGL